jgi:hypothetical protein
MNRTKYLKGACLHCEGHLEFPAEHIGTMVPCPHCGQDTELTLLAPSEQPTVTRRALLWTCIALIVLGLGFGAALVALKRAQRWAERQKQQGASAVPVPLVEAVTNPPGQEAPNSSASEALAGSSVSLEKTHGSSLIYAVGTVKNPSNRQRFGVKVEVDLFNEAGQKTGTASDYRQVLAPGAQWDFKALVVDSKAVSAKISSIREDQ